MLNISGIVASENGGDADRDAENAKAAAVSAAADRAATAIKSSQRWLGAATLLDAALCWTFFSVGSPQHFCQPAAAIAAAPAIETTIDLIALGTLRCLIFLVWSQTRLPLLAKRIEAGAPAAPAAAVMARRQLAAATMISVALAAGKIAALFIVKGSNPAEGGSLDGSTKWRHCAAVLRGALGSNRGIGSCSKPGARYW